MSSYFVNSFSGRYPNGPDYQLLNYGASSGAVTGGAFRDSSSATMHPATGSYGGFSYGGMDLSVSNRGGGGGGGRGHFAGGSAAGLSRGFSSPGPERSFRQTSSCSLGSAADSLLSPGCGDNKLGTPTSPPRSEQPGSANLSSPNLSTSSTSSSGGGCAANRFMELDAASPEPEELQSSRTGHPSQQECGPAGAAAASSASDAQSPQIFPWMRKLHISHGTSSSCAFSLWLVCEGPGRPPQTFPVVFGHTGSVTV